MAAEAGETLRAWLASRPEHERAAVAKLWGLGELRGADELAAAVLREDAVARTLAGLGAAERAALAQLQRRGGTMPAAVLERDYGRVRVPESYPNPRTYLLALQEPPGPLERLYLLALARPVNGAGGRMYAIPPDLLRLLPPAPATEATLAVEAATEPSEVWRADLELLDRRLLGLLELAYDGRLEVTPAGGVTKASMVRVARRWGSDPDLRGVSREEQWPHLQFLRLVAISAGLLRLGTEASLRVTREALEWMRLPRLERLRALLRGWVSSGWDELALMGVRAQRGFGRDVPAARRALLALVAQVPPGTWVDLQAFIMAVKAAEPDYARPDGEYERWRLVGPAGQRLDGFAHWDVVEGGQIREVIVTSLRWLGLVDAGVGVDSAGRFRLTAYGDALLRGAGAPEEPPEEPLVVQPSFEVVAPALGGLYARFQLGRIAEEVSGEATGRYRLTRRSIQAALGRGIDLDELLRFLEESGRGPLPQNVAATLAEWGGRYGQLTLERGHLLRAADPAVLERALRDGRVRMPAVERISETAWLVREGDAQALAERLARAGYGLAGDGAGAESRLSEHDLAVAAAALEFYAAAARLLGVESDVSGALRARVARLAPERRLGRARRASEAVLTALRRRLGEGRAGE